MVYLTVEYLYKVLSMSIITLSFLKTHCLGQNEIPSLTSWESLKNQKWEIKKSAWVGKERDKKQNKK